METADASSIAEVLIRMDALQEELVDARRHLVENGAHIAEVKESLTSYRAARVAERDAHLGDCLILAKNVESDRRTTRLIGEATVAIGQHLISHGDASFDDSSLAELIDRLETDLAGEAEG